MAEDIRFMYLQKYNFWCVYQCHIQQGFTRLPVVSSTNTHIEPITMMIKVTDASITVTTVLGVGISTKENIQLHTHTSRKHSAVKEHKSIDQYQHFPNVSIVNNSKL